jgi:hypothetical protein
VTSQPPRETKGDLAKYLDWLEHEWLPAVKGEHPRQRRRPVLKLIRGGRDAK